jgi:hypothetical protein
VYGAPLNTHCRRWKVQRRSGSRLELTGQPSRAGIATTFRDSRMSSVSRRLIHG